MTLHPLMLHLKLSFSSYSDRSTHSSLLCCRKFLKCTQITAPLTWGDIFLLYWLDIVCGLPRGLPRMDVASHLHKGLWCAPTAPERIGEQRAALTTWQLTCILDRYWCNVCGTPNLRREQLFFIIILLLAFYKPSLFSQFLWVKG